MNRHTPSISFVLLASFVLVPGTAAQSVALGLRSGLNVADVSSDQFQFGRARSRRAAVAGGFITLSGRDRWGFQAEVLYSQKGVSVLGRGGSALAKVDYVDIPLLIKYRVRDLNDRIRPALFAGGFLAFETRCSARGEIAGLDGSGDCGVLLSRRGNTDAGLVLGTSIDIGLANRLFLTFDGRYSIGLANLNWDAENDQIRSRVWSLTGGVGVLLGA